VMGLIGLAVGSFLNVCIDRLPAGQSLVSPRSHCDGCGQPLANRDLIPIVSYLLLRGRCRYCSVAIPARLPLVEAVTGLAFAVSWLWLGRTWMTLPVTVAACVLLVTVVIGLERRRLLARSRRS
jgi:leader peptidase (prepilin peptidase)/N-methyltransferase